MLTLYGIPNCDTVKKARTWLDAAGIAYDFHDYKKQGVDAAVLQQAMDMHGWEVVLNRRGTTWRKLSGEQQASVVDAASALALMEQHPSLVKRPLAAAGENIIVGFNPKLYTQKLVQYAK